MYRSLLVPLDGSPFSEHALPLAAAVARASGAALEVAHVHCPFSFYHFDSAVSTELDERARKEKLAYLESVVRRLAAEAKLQASSCLLVGDEADALHDHVAAGRFDLVVMTTHGRGPLSRFWLGSVADRLIRRLSTPLLLVRPQEAAPNLGQDLHLRRVLVPLDGSELAEQVLQPAAGLAAVLRAGLFLLRVANPQSLLSEESRAYAAGAASPAVLSQWQELAAQQESQARAYLEQVAERLRAQSLPVETCVVSGQTAAAAILETAAGSGSDLIALATHGRGGLARLFLGSVADKVVRGATTPVLLHHPRA